MATSTTKNRWELEKLIRQANLHSFFSAVRKNLAGRDGLDVDYLIDHAKLDLPSALMYGFWSPRPVYLRKSFPGAKGTAEFNYVRVVKTKSHLEYRGLDLLREELSGKYGADTVGALYHELGEMAVAFDGEKIGDVRKALAEKYGDELVADVAPKLDGGELVWKTDIKDGFRDSLVEKYGKELVDELYKPRVEVCDGYTFEQFPKAVVMEVKEGEGGKKMKYPKMVPVGPGTDILDSSGAVIISAKDGEGKETDIHKHYRLTGALGTLAYRVAMRDANGNLILDAHSKPTYKWFIGDAELRSNPLFLDYQKAKNDIIRDVSISKGFVGAEKDDLTNAIENYERANIICSVYLDKGLAKNKNFMELNSRRRELSRYIENKGGKDVLAAIDNVIKSHPGRFIVAELNNGMVVTPHPDHSMAFHTLRSVVMRSIKNEKEITLSSVNPDTGEAMKATFELSKKDIENLAGGGVVSLVDKEGKSHVDIRFDVLEEKIVKTISLDRALKEAQAKEETKRMAQAKGQGEGEKEVTKQGRSASRTRKPKQVPGQALS